MPRLLVLERRRVAVAKTALAVLVQRIRADRAEREIDELVFRGLDREDVPGGRAVARECEAGGVRLADLEEIAVAEAGRAELVRSCVNEGPGRSRPVWIGDIQQEVHVRVYP